MNNNKKLLEELAGRNGGKIRGIEVAAKGTLEKLTFIGQKWLSAEIYTEEGEKALFSDLVFKDLCFDTVSFSGIEFKGCRFVNCSSRILNFCDIRFTDCSFENCDFAGSSFFNSDMTNSNISDVDLACSFFESFKCSRSSFKDTSLSASCFEESIFSDNYYKNVRMKTVEGLSEELFSSLEKEQGVDISLPVEIAFWNNLAFLWKKIPDFLKVIIVFVMAFFFFSNFSKIKTGSTKLMLRDSFPFKSLFMFLSDSSRKDFFIDNFHLPNSGFENKLEHWLFIPDEAVMNQGEFFPDYENFRSFPASLAFKGYKGAVFYSRETEPSGFTGRDVFSRDDIWLPVRDGLRNYKISFHYLNAHPTVNVYGRLKEGGMTLLAEIDRKQDNSGKWIYYSESLTLNVNISFIALRFSSFPEVVFNIDEVSIEKTL